MTYLEDRIDSYIGKLPDNRVQAEAANVLPLFDLVLLNFPLGHEERIDEIVSEPSDWYIAHRFTRVSDDEIYYECEFTRDAEPRFHNYAVLTKTEKGMRIRAVQPGVDMETKSEISRKNGGVKTNIKPLHKGVVTNLSSGLPYLWARLNEAEQSQL